MIFLRLRQLLLLIAPNSRLWYRPLDFPFALHGRDTMAWAILAILVIIAFVLIGMYNSRVQLRVRTDTAWSDIDVQLKRRHDLIPNLVETVTGYAAHEKSTFENVTKFRSQAMQATTPAIRQLPRISLAAL